MSRCLSFPPPGFVWKGLKGEALIDLIKVRREEAEAEKQRKKEKRKRRIEEEEVEEGEIRQKKRHSHHRRHKCHRSNDCGRQSCHNMKKDQESDGLEGSSITEELHQLVSDSIYDSSDNSHNVWRKMLRLPPESHQEHGSPVCIDVSMQKRQDKLLLFRKPVTCSITTMDFVVQQKSELARNQTEQQCCSTHGEASLIRDSFLCSFADSTNTSLESDTASQEWELPPCHPPTLDQLDAMSKEEAEASNCSERGLQHIESAFRELIANWTPPTKMREHLEFESDLEWLFTTRAKRLPQTNMSGTFNVTNDGLCRSGSVHCPTAQHLPQADIHAFPFTIPF